MLSAKTYAKLNTVIASTGFLSGDSSSLDLLGIEREDHGIDKYAYTVSRPDGTPHRQLVKEDRYGRKYIALGGEHVYLGEFGWEYAHI